MSLEVIEEAQELKQVNGNEEQQPPEPPKSIPVEQVLDMLNKSLSERISKINTLKITLENTKTQILTLQEEVIKIMNDINMVNEKRIEWLVNSKPKA
jgi:hypothetical protein